MRGRGNAWVVIAAFAFTASCARRPPGSEGGPISVPVRAIAPASPVEVEPEPTTAAWATALPALTVRNVNTMGTARVTLYARDGSIHEPDAVAIDRVLTDPLADEVRPANRRVMQLAAKAAWHFGAGEIAVISSWREGGRKGSRHHSGQALDFSLPGVPAARLASYLRGFARAGVGVYTNARTQFVHLDVREQSYHWLDGSPPGRTWREKTIVDPGGPARDAAWTAADDLPVSGD
jgi:uncharacterized protein YcbK (DUF882 family)